MRSQFAADQLALVAAKQAGHHNMAKLVLIYHDEFKYMATTKRMNPNFYLLFKEIGRRISIHIGNIEGANSILQGHR